MILFRMAILLNHYLPRKNGLIQTDCYNPSKLKHQSGRMGWIYLNYLNVDLSVLNIDTQEGKQHENAR